MNLSRLACMVLCLAGCVPAAPDLSGAPLARWGEDSGSLPPEYAWDYLVTFTDSGQVSARYCKGYASEAPGCATVTETLPEAQFAALVAGLTPVAAALAANPPQQTDDIPVGGGSIYGAVFVGGATVSLPSYSVEADAQRVKQALDLLQSFTPADLVTKAGKRAKQP